MEGANKQTVTICRGQLNPNRNVLSWCLISALKNKRRYRRLDRGRDPLRCIVDPFVSLWDAKV